MLDSLVLVERKKYLKADIATSAFIEAGAWAFQTIRNAYPEEIGRFIPKPGAPEETRCGVREQESTGVEVTLTGVVLATSLSKANVSYVLFDDENIIDKYEKELVALIESGLAYVCISTTFMPDIKILQNMIRFFRERDRAIKIIVGGQCLYIWGDSAFAKLDDVFCFCYGDMDDEFGMMLARLLRGENPATFLTIMNKYGKSFYTFNHFIANLDTIGMPDWGILTNSNINNYYYVSHPLPDRVPVEDRRGCLNRCAFCSYHTLNQHRQKSPQRILDELINIKRAGYSRVHFVGSEFLMPPAKTKETLELIIRNRLNLDILCFGRIDVLAKHPEIVELMAAAGITTVYFGVESGDQSILKKMNKNYDLEKIPGVIDLLKKHSIEIWASFIFGFPGETDETIRNTSDFIVRSNFSTVEFHALQVVPGTPLHTERQQYSLNLVGGLWSHPTMSLLDIPEVIKKVYTAIYPRCDSSVLNISNGIGQYFVLSDHSPEARREFDRKLHELMYVYCDDTASDREARVLQIWNGLKSHIDCVPRFLTEKKGGASFAE